MRASFLALTTVLLGLAVVPSPSGPAAASCAAPRLSIERAVLMPGDEVTVTGEGFTTGCADTGTSSAFGCSGDDGGDEADPEPLTGIQLVAVQKGRDPEEIPLAAADAVGENGQVTWTFVVPPISPGRAVLQADESEPLPVRIAPVVIVD